MFLVAFEKAKKKSKKEHTSPSSPATSVELAAAGSLDRLHTWPWAAGPTGKPTSWVDVTGLNPGDRGVLPVERFTQQKQSQASLFFANASEGCELVRSGSCNKMPSTGWLKQQQTFTPQNAGV